MVDPGDKTIAAQGAAVELTAAGTIANVARRYLLNPPQGDDPVVRLAAPDQLEQLFASVAPIQLGDRVEPLKPELLSQLCELIVAQSVQTSHPRFFNQNFAGPDPVAVAGDWLGAALNTTGATFEAAPVFTMLEMAVLAKLAAVAGLPQNQLQLAPGLFAPGGSTATLYALQLARHRLRPDIVHTGLSGERLALFVSDTGHYAAVKSAALLGLGTDAVTKVATDDHGAMIPDALQNAITASRTEGTVPFAVIGTAGTTVTAAFDPLGSLGDICQAEGLWLHVDGCYGGSALFSAAQRHRLDGVARADSLAWNLHKMLGMTQQCTVLLLADPAQLGPCFATGADYIFQPDKLHGDYDTGDQHFQCARRVDALKLWLAWRVHGDQGFADRIDHAVAMADYARSALAGRAAEFETVIAGDFTNVIFRWKPAAWRGMELDDDAARAQLHRLAPAIKRGLQRSGQAMLGVQPVGGVNSFRLLFMNPSVQPTDIDAALDAISSIGSSVASAI